MERPIECKGKNLDRMADQFGVTRGWFEGDKSLKRRILWVCYGGSLTDPKFRTPLRRAVDFFRGVIPSRRSSHA